jgi:hypothetical protein
MPFENSQSLVCERQCKNTNAKPKKIMSPSSRNEDMKISIDLKQCLVLEGRGATSSSLAGVARKQHRMSLVPCGHLARDRCRGSGGSGNGLCLLAGEEVDVLIATRSTPEDRAMRMESSGGDRGATILLQEVGVGLQTGKFLAIEIENLD